MPSQDQNNTSIITHFSLWVTFQYIILFICLYVSAISLGGILHRVVDKNLPDSLNTINNYGGPFFSNTLLQGYLAGIIVTFPIFAVLFLLLKKQLINNPIVKNLQARKTLIYITLVVTFIIIIGHLISTVYGFLGGNATINSLAHLGVTFLVAGSIFIYLINGVKEDRKSA